MRNKSHCYCLIVLLISFQSIKLLAAEKKTVPLNGNIAIPYVDLVIESIDVGAKTIEFGLRNVNSFVGISINNIQCNRKYAIISGIELGKPISHKNRISVLVQKPCDSLIISLNNRKIYLKLAENSNKLKNYSVDLSKYIEPYLDLTDFKSPIVRFIGNKDEKKFLKKGDSFKFQVTDNRGVKNVFLDGSEKKPTSEGFINLTLKDSPLFNKTVRFKAVDINGNETTKSFTLTRNYIESIKYFFHNPFFLWLVFLMVFLLGAPFMVKKFKKVLRRRRKKNEIERIRRNNEKWHNTRDARKIKNSLQEKKERLSRVSKQYQHRKAISDNQENKITELNRENNLLNKKLSSYKSNNQRFKKKIKRLKLNLENIEKENKRLKESHDFFKGSFTRDLDFSLPEKKDECLKILGLNKDYSKTDLRKARNFKTHLYHPDKVDKLGPKLKKVATLEMKRVNQAFNILMKYKGKK